MCIGIMNDSPPSVDFFAFSAFSIVTLLGLGV